MTKDNGTCRYRQNGHGIANQSEWAEIVRTPANVCQRLPLSARLPHPVQANRQKRWNDKANTHSPIRPTLKRQIAIARHAEWAQSVPPPPQSPTSPFAAQNKTKKRKKKRKSQVRAIISWDGTHIKQAVSYLWISITCEEPLHRGLSSER